MRGQITVKSTISKESGRDSAKGLTDPHCTTSLDEKINLTGPPPFLTVPSL